MKLYRVYSYNYGLSMNNRTIPGSGSNVRVFTRKAEAMREFNSEKKRLLEQGVRFTLDLQQIATPDRLTADQWIDAIEVGDLPYDIHERLEHFEQREQTIRP